MKKNQLRKDKQTFKKMGATLKVAADKTANVMGRLSNQKQFSLIRDSFSLLIPLTIVSGLTIVFLTVIFGGWNSLQSSLLGLIAHGTGNTVDHYATLTSNQVSWDLIDVNSGIGLVSTKATAILGVMFDFGIGKLTLYFAMSLGYCFARQRNKNPLFYIIVSVGTLLIMTKSNINHWNAYGLFQAMVINTIVLEIFSKLDGPGKFVIKMPASVPPGIARSFAVLIPILIITLLDGLILFCSEEFFIYFDGGTSYNMVDITNKIFIAPFLQLVNSGADISLFFLYIVIVKLFWFFGIHGGNTLAGVFTVPSVVLWVDNLAGANHVFTIPTYTAYCMPLVPVYLIMLFFLKKRNPALYNLGKFSFIPAIFNVGEPIVFGVPIVFNFKLFIPFMLAPIICGIATAIAISGHLVHADIIPYPWTAPLGLAGLISSGFDWRSLVLTYLCWGITFVIWFPFLVFVQKEEGVSTEQEVISKRKGVLLNAPQK